MNTERHDGGVDIARAVEHLAQHQPRSLASLATLAYNYRWSWRPETEALFRRIEPDRWSRCGQNPVRLLQEVDPWVLEDLARDAAFVEELDQERRALEQYLLDHQAREAPIAYLCAEFGIHRSLPFYSGGLGILAGDFLKQASDQRFAMVGVGLFYREGSFHQHIDVTGWQHEYWQQTDSDRLPAVLVTSDHAPLLVHVRIRDRPVAIRVWRVDVGAVPLYLLDTDVASNATIDRWITSRLYVANREIRLAQYAVLGIGGVRALRAMGLAPRLLHLNEGHAALATLALLRERLAAGEAFAEAVEGVRQRVVFSTHTPLAAGNESFGGDEVDAILPRLSEETGIGWDRLAPLLNTAPGASHDVELTPLALRLSARANGVSRLHGDVARRMWNRLWPDRAAWDVPIGHVTNGIHLPTWMAPEWQQILSEYVPGWSEAAPSDEAWAGIERIPDELIWTVRCALRAQLADYVRTCSVDERLGRGERIGYAESAVEAWRDNVLTLGFARRIATYKRLYLLTSQPDRAVRLLTGSPSLQIVIAGRAHPADEPAKATVQQLFSLNDFPLVGGRGVFLEEYDLGLARQLVRGCDLWLNLPRRPLEASGTSGMKSAANGGLQLSVLDGWWAEGYRPGIGWAIESAGASTPDEQDRRDADQVFDLLEHEVLPLFYERDERGLPGRWIAMLRASMRELVPRFSARRMADDYLATVYGRPERD